MLLSVKIGNVKLGYLSGRIAKIWSDIGGGVIVFDKGPHEIYN